jgi:quinol-cytochrome oxidoreductase complex cytochrome b subunit
MRSSTTFSLSRFVGGITRHLLLAACACIGALGVTGAALSLAYEPSLRPALTENGDSIGLVEVLVPIKRKPPAVSFIAGEILSTPLESGGKEFRVSNPRDDTLRRAARIIVEAVSGAPLIPTTAFYSVAQEIEREMEFGWFVRSAHRAATGGATLALTLWMGFALLSGQYRRYAPLAWTCGVILWILVFVGGALGSILPMNLRSAAALEIALSTLESTPLVGGVLAGAARGAPVVASVTLVRLYAAHILFVPALVGICLYGLWRARAHQHCFTRVFSRFFSLKEQEQHAQAQIPQERAQKERLQDSAQISLRRIDAALNVVATLWLCAAAACFFSLGAPFAPPELVLPASLAQIPPASATLSAEWYALGVVAYLRMAPAWSLSVVLTAFVACTLALPVADKYLPRLSALLRGALCLAWACAVALSAWEIFVAAARVPHLWSAYLSAGLSERTSETFAVTTILSALLIGVLLLQRRFFAQSVARALSTPPQR